MKTAALVLAAGRGRRLERPLPKAFARVAGRTLLARSLEALAAVPAIDRLVPVVAEEDLPRFRALDLSHLEKLAEPALGGRERQDSVRAGLAALPVGVEWVAVHDAARCLVRPADVSRVLSAAQALGAAILASPARDTLKRVREGRVVETPPRSECWVAQTPQVFRVDVLRAALEKADAEGFVGTDDAELVERLGVSVGIVEGDPGNLKITLPADLELAERLLTEDTNEGRGA